MPRGRVGLTLLVEALVSVEPEGVDPTQERGGDVDHRSLIEHALIQSAYFGARAGRRIPHEPPTTLAQRARDIRSGVVAPHASSDALVERRPEKLQRRVAEDVAQHDRPGL